MMPASDMLPVHVLVPTPFQRRSLDPTAAGHDGAGRGTGVARSLPARRTPIRAGRPTDGGVGPVADTASRQRPVCAQAAAFHVVASLGLPGGPGLGGRVHTAAPAWSEEH